MNLTTEEKLEKVRDLRPIDDVFFEVLAQNKEVCQEILRVILEDDALIVTETIVQSSKSNLYGRGVRLDALCILKNGDFCNIEIQRSNNDNHLKRARFNASMITVKESDAGTKFEDIKDVYVVYISEFDFLKGGKTIYHIDKVIRETGIEVDDGLHEIFVNTVIDDGSDIAELMSCFIKKEFKNAKFPKFSEEVKRLKETQGGAQAVCEVMQMYEDLAVKKDHIEKIQIMLKEGFKEEMIYKLGYTEEEYQEAKEKYQN